MRLFTAILAIFMLVIEINCLSVKRFFAPSSPMFSLIAHHKGEEFQYNLVKFNGSDIVLGGDEQAFFGRIKANNGYTLNLPLANGTNTTYPSNRTVYVDKTYKLTTTALQNQSSEHFGLNNSLLTYQNSSKFMACPNPMEKGQYEIYANTKAKNITCPSNSTGFEIALLVQLQVDAGINYNPSTNKASLFGKKR